MRETMSQTTSMQIIHDLQKNLPDSKNMESGWCQRWNSRELAIMTASTTEVMAA